MSKRREIVPMTPREYSRLIDHFGLKLCENLGNDLPNNPDLRITVENLLIQLDLQVKTAFLSAHMNKI